MKTVLTKQEYYQLLGLMTLVTHTMARLTEIESSIRLLFDVQKADYDVSGVGDPEHIGDAIYSGYTADVLMEKLGVTVE